MTIRKNCTAIITQSQLHCIRFSSFFRQNNIRNGTISQNIVFYAYNSALADKIVFPDCLFNSHRIHTDLYPILCKS